MYSASSYPPCKEEEIDRKTSDPVGECVPMSVYVEQILTQSRTTVAVLQVALFYIEVLCPKLRTLMHSSASLTNSITSVIQPIIT